MPLIEIIIYEKVANFERDVVDNTFFIVTLDQEK